jgi:BirA family biotin operon repressor/biotin-[acetyl-CoA-carboxylase] ligase
MTTDAHLLTALRTAGSHALSAKDLATQLGISRSAVSARIHELRSLGYDITTHPHEGYRLVASPDLLHADDLFSRLGKIKTIGRDIRVFGQTTSTNDVIEKLAQDGVTEGVVVFAESQTRGRGRLGRKWVSPPKKGLWFSILLRPAFGPQSATRLTIMSAVALRRALAQQSGLQPEIKWPNDILLNDKKLAGILIELSAELDRIKHVIVGIGVDVNLATVDLPTDLRKIATSLQIETGRFHSRPELAAAILRELDRSYERVSDRHFPALADEWEEHCSTVGSSVAIRLGNRTICGRAESLDPDGALLVRTQHGHLEHVSGGDVTLEK